MNNSFLTTFVVGGHILCVTIFLILGDYTTAWFAGVAAYYGYGHTKWLEVGKPEKP